MKILLLTGFCAFIREMKTKTCFIVLEKLDKKLINHYLEKWSSTESTTKNVGSVYGTKNQPVKKNVINKNSKENRRHKRKTSKDLATKNELMQKKRKIKTFNYADDISNKSVSEKKESASENYKIMKLRVTSELAGERKESTLKETYENAKDVTMKYKGQGPLEVEKNNNVILNSILKNSYCCRTENHVVTLSTADNEIEVFEEYLNLRSTSQSKNYDKIEANHNREKLLNGDSVRANIFEEDEYDLREDSEDDKKTVIFEEDFQKERDLDIFDIDQKKIEPVERKLKKREITNWKVQKVIQFKTKNVENSMGAMRKSEAKVTELFIEQEASEVLPSPEDVSEDLLKEVCCMVQRLYELYKIILHLQAELQNNKRLSLYFSQAITDQQKQFQTEIRKNQKTIIKCYEKLLLFYKNANKVALIISERTSLSALEVIEVISQCLLVEGACEIKESRNRANQTVGKEKVFQPLKVSCNSDSLSKIITDNSEMQYIGKTVQNKNHLVPPSHCYFPPGKNPELRQGMTNNSMSILTTPVKENCKISSQKPTNPAIGTLPTEHQMQKIQQEKLKSYLKQKKLIQKLHPQNVVQNSEVEQSQQVQHMIVFPRNDHLKNGFAFPNRNIIQSDCSANASPFQRSNFTVPPTPIGSTEFSLSVQLLNSNSKNSSVNHVERTGSGLSHSRSRIPVVAGNIAQCRTQQYQSNLQNGALPAEICNEMINAQRQFQTPSNETRFFLNRTLINSVRFSNQKFGNLLRNELLLHSGKMGRSRFEMESNGIKMGNVPSRVPKDSQVLDPTVPKKLTMKNWKLQAGPVLHLESEGENMEEPKEKQKPCQTINEKRLDCHWIRNPDQEDSKAREYVCAQNDCKKPGVLICQGCRSVIYCSETCQLKNWTEKHLIECYQLKKLRG